MTFHLNSQNLCLGQITDQYADVYLHVEENGIHSIIKANKVILAFHSPYFHRIFQSRANIQTVDVAFVGIKPFLLREALKMMYGQNIEVSEILVDRFLALLNLLEIDFEKRVGYLGVESSKNQKKIKLGQNMPNVSTKCTAEESSIENENDLKESAVEDMSHVQKHSPTKSSLVNISTPMTFSVPTVASSSTSPSVTSTTSSVTTTGPSITSTTPSVITTTPASLSNMNVTINPMTTPSISKPRIANADKRSETVPDNLTETSESGLSEELNKIDFNIGVSAAGHHKDYVCCHCSIVVKSLVQAKIHFVDNHQNCDEEKETISEIMKYKKVAIKEIQEVQKDIHNGANKILATSQLTNIIENLRKHEDTLNKLKEKNLPPNLMRKRSDIIKSFNDIIIKVETFIDSEINN